MSISSHADVASSMSSSISVDTRLWELNITPSPGGSVSGSGSYYRQATVSVKATPLPGYSFESWSGNASGTNNPISITMDGHKSISAVFVEEFMLIPAGSFLMGRTTGEIYGDAPPVTVTLSAFYIGKNEVTKELWDEVYTWAKSNGYNDFSEFFNNGKPNNHPVSSISWFDAVKWCNARSQKEGLIPCYTVNGSVMKNGTTAPTMNWTANGYRLPTEAEWEKAARGGVSGKRFPWGDDTISHNQANYRSNTGFFHPIYSSNTTGPYTSPIGSFAENGYGLNDMAGNVCEWCWDWYGESSYVNDAADPRSIGSAAINRVSRGGSWYETDWHCSAAQRGFYFPETVQSFIGFRIARNVDNANTIARDDQDNDGILDVREIHQLGTNPNLADSNANGLSDAYELIFQGGAVPFIPRLGDRVRYDLNRLGYQGAYKLVGTLPAGLTFNASSGILEGKVAGTAKINKLSIQVLDGKTVVRVIPLIIPVQAFPSSLAGKWQVLLENEQGLPEGLITITISSPGKWSASFDGIGTRTVRNSSGSLDLRENQESVEFLIAFPRTSNLPSGLPEVTFKVAVDGTTALVSGSYPMGSLRGFRLARGAELPAISKPVTVLFDQGKQDGIAIPAGMGWATGSLSNRGVLSLSGQLGDAQAFRTNLSLGATGQALMWVKPYKNAFSYMGGVVSLHETEFLPASSLFQKDRGLHWFRAPDATELSYPAGFATLATFVGVRGHAIPLNSLSLSQRLGLSNQMIQGVSFDGGGLPDPASFAVLPNAFTIDSNYRMLSVPKAGQLLAPWSGSINSRSGGFTGKLGVVASNAGTIAGGAAVSGVLFPTAGSNVVGAGLVKIPIAGRTGEFRTGAIILGSDQPN